MLCLYKSKYFQKTKTELFSSIECLAGRGKKWVKIKQIAMLPLDGNKKNENNK